MASGYAHGTDIATKILKFINHELEAMEYLLDERIIDGLCEHSVTYLSELVENQHSMYNLSFVYLNNKLNQGNEYSYRFKEIKMFNNKFLSITYDYDMDVQSKMIGKDHKWTDKPSVKVTTFGGFSQIILPNDDVQKMASSIENKMRISETCFLLGYGCSGAGKTYTLIGTESNKGLICHLCDKVQLNLKDTYETKYKKKGIVSMYLWVSEFYMDKLQTNSVIEGRQCTNEDLHKILFERFIADRKTEETTANNTSSRSHCLAIIQFRTVAATDDDSVAATVADDDKIIKNIIIGDYAGVEPESSFQLPKEILDAIHDCKEKNKEKLRNELIASIPLFDDKVYVDVLKKYANDKGGNSIIPKHVFTNRKKDALLFTYIMTAAIDKISFERSVNEVRVTVRINFMITLRDEYIQWKKINDEAISINNSLLYMKRDLKAISEERKNKMYGKVYISNIATECFDTYFLKDKDVELKANIDNPQVVDRVIDNNHEQTITLKYISDLLKTEAFNVNMYSILPCILCVADISSEMDKPLKNPYDDVNKHSILNQKSMMGSLEFADKFSKLFSIPNTCHATMKDAIRLR
jgi:hypothetical protein